jgi:hypothetical protein
MFARRRWMVRKQFLCCASLDEKETGKEKMESTAVILSIQGTLLGGDSAGSQTNTFVWEKAILLRK